MNVQELIEILNEVEDKSLQVWLVTDHGQQLMKCDGNGIGYIDSDSYMPDEIHVDDLGEYDDAIKVFVLEAF